MSLCAGTTGEYSRPTCSTSRTCCSTRFISFGLRALARLMEGREDNSEYVREADRSRDALIAKCWDEEAGAFFDLSGVAERSVRVVTISSLMPLILEDLPREIVSRLVDGLLTSPEHFWLPYPLPSVGGIGAKVHAGEPSRLHLARPHLDEHQLVSESRPAASRLPRAGRRDSGEEPAASSKTPGSGSTTTPTVARAMERGTSGGPP